MRKVLPILLLGLAWPHAAAAAVTRVGSCSGTTNCSSAPSHQAGDLFIAGAFRNGSATLPANPSGWTSASTLTLNGSGSNDSAMRLSCKVATSSSETITGFTNASVLSVIIYRGQAAGNTASCASAILQIVTFASTVNTLPTTASYPALTAQDGDSWVAGFIGVSHASDASTAPSGMVNQTSSGSGPMSAAHDTNGGAASWPSTDVTIDAGSRIMVFVVEVKADPCFGVSCPAYVQHLSTGSATGTFGSSVTSGNAVLAWIGWDGNQSATASVSDNAGNTYELISYHNWNGTTSRTALLIAKNVTGHAALQLTFSVTGSPTIWNRKATEFSGVDADPLDDFRIANGNNNAPNSGAYTTASGKVVLWGGHDEASGTFTGNTGFTSRGDNLFDKVAGSSSSQSFGGTFGGSTQWVAWVVGLKEPAAGGGGPGAPAAVQMMMGVGD